MAIFRLTKQALVPLEQTGFANEGYFERGDLQRLIRDNVQTLDADLLVVSEEFGDWTESSRRIDLLCIDREANLVVVELKRTDDGGHMDLQALRYAAMVSQMTFAQLLVAYRSYLTARGQLADTAKSNVLNFLDWDEGDDERFGGSVRIILAAADFSKEITTSVLWLNTQGLRIQCVRLKPYRDPDGGLLLDVQQLIPLPEAMDFQTQINAKEQAEKAEKAERYDLRFRFWSQLLSYAKTRTNLHSQRSPGDHNWIGGSAGRRGFQLNYSVRDDEAQVEIYIDLGPGYEDVNKAFFNQIFDQKAQIERELGYDLDWQKLPERRASRIRRIVSGGYRSPESEWPRIHEALVTNMIALDRALRPIIQRLPSPDHL